jgi:protection-of-telomeres protein 1
MIAQQPAKAKTAAPPSSFDTEFLASSPPRKAGDMPDDSDSENEKPASKSSTHKPKSPVLKEHNSNAGTSVNLIKGLGDENLAMTLVPRNKAFTCCIKQYGVQVKEDESGKANAGNGKRWQRMFALFGTNIM